MTNIKHSKKIIVSQSFYENIKKHFYLYAIILICTIFFLLKMTSSHNLIWDESIYLGMGKYIYSGGSSGLWEMIRPLGLPLMTGLWWKLGLNQIIVSRIISIIVSLGMIIVTSLIAKELFDKKHAIISALILACTPIFFLYSDYILTDHISTLFLMISVLFIMKEKFVCGGIFGGLAFWFKFTHILYVVALGLFFGYKLIKYIIENRDNSTKNKTYKVNIIHNKSYVVHIMYAVAIILLFVALYFFSNYMLYKNHYNTIDAISKPYLNAAAYSNNPYQNISFNDVKSFFYYLFYYPYNIIFNHTYGFLAYILSLIYIIHYGIKYRNFVRKDSDVLLLIIFSTYLLYYTIIPYKTDRFWITFLPIMAIYSAYGLMQLISYIYEIKPINLKKNIMKIFLLTRTIVLVILILIIFSMAILKDIQIHKWNTLDAKNNHDIEKYFDINNIDGPILVTNPIFTAYSDKRYIGAYDVLSKNAFFVNEWEANIEFNAVAYMNSSIPCLADDAKCIANKEKLNNMIKNDFRKTDSYMYQGSEITFYVK